MAFLSLGLKVIWRRLLVILSRAVILTTSLQHTGFQSHIHCRETQTLPRHMRSKRSKASALGTTKLHDDIETLWKDCCPMDSRNDWKRRDNCFRQWAEVQIEALHLGSCGQHCTL